MNLLEEAEGTIGSFIFQEWGHDVGDQSAFMFLGFVA